MTQSAQTVGNNRLKAVITSIQEPTEAVAKLASRLLDIGSNLIVIGDKKGPLSFDLEGVEFHPLSVQMESEFDLARLLPTGHYARKNVGYLEAIADGACTIYETDDDNAPLDSWGLRPEFVDAHAVDGSGWVNVFRTYTREAIWPRGFPLDEIRKSFDGSPSLAEQALEVQAPIQQGLANNSPDVDAIWRLVFDRPFEFETGPSIWLRPGSWCPFNSQSTWWYPTAYPLLYLPSYCSFRMTDIWRSFIAQRCLWELDLGIVFHGAEVYQERNAHALTRDFADEVPGYLRNKELVKILEELKLRKGADSVGSNLFICYKALVKAQFFSKDELVLVEAWLKDLRKSYAE